MRWNPFRRAENADASDSGFESTVVDDAAVARIAAAARGTGPLPMPARVDAGPPPALRADSAAMTAAARPAAPVDDVALAALAADGENIGHIGRYALKAVLGQGGLGTVYAAWDPLLSRTVALKTLHIDSDPASRESMDALFLNEARAAAGLSHPHIVTVFDAGPSENGIYIAMERLQGQDLRHLLQKGSRPGPIEVAHIVRRVAEALAYAHRKGVVHCDIKPANIFMSGRMHPKVLDFGIARVAHREASPLLDGIAAGSPYYLAPEQIDGRSIDRRSDVYSLGVVMYELLTGKKPFEGKSVDDITRAVRQADVVPAHRAAPKVPLGLSVITARAMARDPDQRYPSARHLSMELRHWSDSAEARALTSGARVDGGLRGAWRSASALARAGLVAAMVILGAGLTWLRVHPDTARPAVAGAAAPAAPVAAPRPAAVTPPPAAAVAASAMAVAPAGLSVASAAAPVNADSAARVADRASGARGDHRHKASAPVPAETTAPVAQATAPALGVVQLAVSPWGQIEVDGRTLGTSPPLTRLTLPSGSHTIIVRNADFPAYTATLQVSGDNPVTLRHRFGP